MAKMSRYCKAIPRARFSEFRNFLESPPASDSVTEEQSFHYLHENFVVTRDIFVDENIVFDAITPEWIEFCRESLRFRPEEIWADSASSDPQPGA